MIPVKIDVFDVKQKVKTDQKRSSGPKTNLFDEKQTGRGRSETNNAGVKKLSSFIWTFMMTKEHGHMTMENDEGWGG